MSTQKRHCRRFPSRHCEERSDETIQRTGTDRHASLAMTQTVVPALNVIAGASPFVIASEAKQSIPRGRIAAAFGLAMTMCVMILS